MTFVGEGGTNPIDGSRKDGLNRTVGFSNSQPIKPQVNGNRVEGFAPNQLVNQNMFAPNSYFSTR